MPRGYHNDFAVTENSKPLSGQEGTTPSYPQARSTGLSNTFNMHMQLAINSYISHQLPLKCTWSLQNQLSRLQNGRNFFCVFQANRDEREESAIRSSRSPRFRHCSPDGNTQKKYALSFRQYDTIVFKYTFLQLSVT